ncbi:MAG: NAD(P)-binding domain-containing protein [Actinomycetota bacterium]|nr:NAD(P)-binding domain-containing protein [Actinomycetota bacterium]
MPGAQLVLGDYSGEIVVDAAVVAAMDRVRLFHQPATGYDAVDVEACARAGIPVTNAGRATSVAMAEHTVMVTLALLKSLVWCDGQVRAGAWPQHDVVARSLVDLAGKTVGLVGLGGAGEETARRLAAFGCDVVYTARTRRAAEVEAALEVRWLPLEALLAESDVVCLLVALNAATTRMIDAAALARMRPGAFLVNVARGGVVDEEALVAALRERRIAGAALDVFASEPLDPSSPLRGLDNVVLTPHVAGATLETRLRMLSRSFEVLTAAARGTLPDGVVNGVTRLR